MSEKNVITGKEVLKKASESVHDLIGALAQSALEKQFGKQSEPDPKTPAQDVAKSTDDVADDKSQYVTKSDMSAFAENITKGISDALNGIFADLNKATNEGSQDGNAGDASKSDDTANADIKKSKGGNDIEKSQSTDLSADEVGSIIAKSLLSKSNRKSFVISNGNVVNKSLDEVENGQEINVDDIDIREYENLDKSTQSQMLKTYIGSFMRS